MHLSRELGGNYPFRLNVPVLESALVDLGELMMRHTSWASSATKYYHTAYSAATTEAEDTIGVSQARSSDLANHPENNAFYKIGSDGLPNATNEEGSNFMPVIANPHALYYAFYDQADAISITTGAATTTLTVSSLENHIDSGWMYTTDGTDSSATYVGSLRYLTASASGTATMDSADTTDTSSDIILLLPIGHRLTQLNAESTGLGTTAAAGAGLFLEVVENYGTWRSAPTHMLRFWNDKGLDGLGGKIARFEAEIVQLKHTWHGTLEYAIT